MPSRIRSELIRSLESRTDISFRGDYTGPIPWVRADLVHATPTLLYKAGENTAHSQISVHKTVRCGSSLTSPGCEGSITNAPLSLIISIEGFGSRRRKRFAPTDPAGACWGIRLVLWNADTVLCRHVGNSVGSSQHQSVNRERKRRWKRFW